MTKTIYCILLWGTPISGNFHVYLQKDNEKSDLSHPAWWSRGSFPGRGFGCVASVPPQIHPTPERQGSSMVFFSQGSQNWTWRIPSIHHSIHHSTADPTVSAVTSRQQRLRFLNVAVPGAFQGPDSASQGWVRPGTKMKRPEKMDEELNRCICAQINKYWYFLNMCPNVDRQTDR